MVQYDQHLILNRLDDPVYILNWTVDEAAFVLASPMFGLMVDQLVLSVIIAGAGFYSLRFLKRKFGSGTLKHAAYWYLPHNDSKLKVTPPSYIREYLG